MKAARSARRPRAAAVSQGQRATATPTPERLARGEVEIVRLDPKDAVGAINVYRTAAGLYNLRRSGSIDDAHVAGAEMWARDYETGVLGASDPELGQSKGRGDIHDVMLARVGAGQRCAYVRRYLGRAGETLLIMLMIDGLSVSAIGERMHRDKKNISGAIMLLLDQLVELYDGMPWKAGKD